MIEAFSFKNRNRALAPVWRIARAGMAIMAFASLVGAASLSVAAAKERPVLRVSSEPETVFRWATDRCDDHFIPDSPARAYRKRNGRIVVIAAHHTNQVLEGSSFNDLRPNCSAKSMGKDLSQPEAFDTLYWIQGLMPLPNNGVLALVSHEYQGKRFDNCDQKARSGMQCWYSSILVAVGDEDTFHFELVSIEQRIAAAPPFRFDPKIAPRVGFFTTSNIVFSGDWAYFVGWMELPGKNGNCLFRAPISNPIGHWTAFKEGQFNQSFKSPYAADNSRATCDPVGGGNLNGQLRSIIRLTEHDVWVGVFTVASASRSESGIYYSFSDDLIEWSPSKLLYQVQPWYNASGCGAFQDYPSLIDQASTSSIFDSGGTNLDLYLTRLNWENCDKGLNRDLVRVRITVGQN